MILNFSIHFFCNLKASIILKENSEKLNEASNAFLKNLKPLHNHIEQAVEADELFKKTSSLTDTIDSVYTNIHDAETKLQNFHSGSLNCKYQIEFYIIIFLLKN